MKTLLFINACVRKDESRTLKLSKAYIDKFIERSKDEYEVKNLELNDLNIKIQDRDELEKREKLIADGNFNDEMFDLAKEFMNADHVVIGAPFWDLQFPALLKIYLERISVTYLTFVYDEMGIPHGQCKAKEAAYVMTAGGYSEGMNYGYEYVKGLFTKLFSFDDVKLISAEGLDIFGNNPDEILREAIEKI